MGLGPLNPGCICCSCTGWSGSPPAEMQLTLPSSCTRSGAHLLDNTNTSKDYALDCPGASLFSSLCQIWWIYDGDTLIFIAVGDDAGGSALIVAGICSEGCSGIGEDCGNLWAANTAITDWSQFDAISLPFHSGETCTSCGGIANCTGTPDDALVDLPP